MSLELNKLVAYFSVGDSDYLCSHSYVDCGVRLSVLSKYIFGLSVFLLSISVFSLTSVAATNINSSLKDITVIRSLSGRYTVAGKNSAWNASVMRQLEVLDGKVENITGLKMPFGYRRIRVGVYDKPLGSSNITWAQGYHRPEFSQRLTIYDYMHVDVAELEVVMCGLFLNGYVFRRQLDIEARRESGGDLIGVKPGRVPSWLALGVARNLYSSYRAENSMQVLDMYDKGELPSVKQLLNKFGGFDQSSELNRHLCGMFVLWLSKMPEKATVFDKLFGSIARDEFLLADDFTKMIKGCSSVNELERMWVDWIYKQRRIVHGLGVTTSGMVEKFESMLVVTPVECREADGPAVNWNISFGELILSREESWISSCARKKIFSLKFMFIGRGSDLADVVDDYCDFLVALEKGKSEKRLVKLLEKAEASKILMLKRYGEENLLE